MKRGIVAVGIIVLAVAGCSSGGAQPAARQASTSAAPVPVVQHPANGCWTVAKPYIATLADDLAKQAKLLRRIVRGTPIPLRATARDTTLRSEARGVAATGDLCP
jgi:hypothetical protein